MGAAVTMRWEVETMTWDQVLTWLVMPAVVAIILGGGGLWGGTTRAAGIRGAVGRPGGRPARDCGREGEKSAHAGVEGILPCAEISGNRRRRWLQSADGATFGAARSAKLQFAAGNRQSQPIYWAPGWRCCRSLLVLPQRLH